QHLELDMPGLDEVLLYEDRSVAERGLRDPLASGDRVLQPFLVLDNLHPDAPAPGACLHDDRVSDRLCDLLCIVDAADAAVRARQDRDAGLFHHLLAADLRSHRFDRLPPWPDKSNALVKAELRKPVVLGQEPVARVDRLGAALLRNIEDPLHVQVALRRVGLADMECLVCILYVECILVGVRINRYGLDIELTAGPHYPYCNLPAVGYQEFLKKFHWTTSRTSPFWTTSPVSTKISVTLPSTGLWIGFSIFMASSTMSGSPFFTRLPRLTSTWRTMPCILLLIPPAYSPRGIFACGVTPATSTLLPPTEMILTEKTSPSTSTSIMPGIPVSALGD